MSDNYTKKCAVCGDTAAGYNFNVLTCVSCKAFFRRNAPKVRQLKCVFNEKCHINCETRKFCSKCRLNRCFDVGMNKELILSEEEKEIRKNRVLEKRKNSKLNNKSIESIERPLLSIDSTKQSTTEQKSSDSSDNGFNIEDQLFNEILEDDSISGHQIEQQVKELQNSITDETDDEISPEVYRKCLELEFAVLPVIRPVTDYKNNFSEMEGNRLTELFSALNIMKCPLGQVTIKTDNWMDAMCVIADDFEVMIEKLVQSSKRLTFFNDLCNDDQIALIKYGALEVCCMRQVIGYDYQTDHMIVPGENPNDFVLINLEVIKEKTVYLYDANKKFYQKIGKEWDSDHTILDLLTAIVFFNADRPNLSDKEAIRYQQYVYMYLLKRYLQLKYGSECVVTTKFLRLMNTIKYLHNLYLKHIQLYVETSKSSGCQCGGILDEVYKV